ncbi:MAG: class I SAM-dependent methyltransferase [Deltaproteobacteria bacterium]|nr:class I SAM-dependent methyltransferase [Deltaproteobacteria bacterium]
MSKIDPKNLIDKNPIFESLFAPLYFKASETKRLNPIVKDPKAVETIDSLDYDFSYFEKNTSGQFLISVRTKILDDQVSEFINGSENPVIINLGSGLDTRYSRLHSQKIKYWYEIDLWEVIEFRNFFFPDTENHKSIGKSVLDYSWIEDIYIDPSCTYLFVVEGLLMYFGENEIKDLFNQISNNFPSSVMLCEVFHTKLVNYNVKNKENNKDISFKWGISDTKDMNSLHSGITIENEWAMFDYHKKRQKIFVRLLVKISPKFRNMVKIIKLKFNKSHTKN